MSARRSGGVAPIHILLLVAFLEVAINRVAVPMLRPLKGAPPTWHTVLDYCGLFLFYFTGTLAAFLIGAHIVKMFRRPTPLVVISQVALALAGILAAVPLVMHAPAAFLIGAHIVKMFRRPTPLVVISQVALALAGILAAVPLVMHAPAALSIPLESLFALAIITLGISAIGRDRDLGALLGLLSLALPLLIHSLSVFAARYIWPEGAFDGPVVTIVRLGVMALSIAALVSPYVFAPRPFARAVTRPFPIVFAMAIAAIGAVIARSFYSKVAKAASLAIGVELSTTHADPRLALYLLAIATLAWTLASCALAGSPARRQIGAGIGLVVLGGYGFHWPNHYLLPLFGFALVADAIARVREEELSSLPVVADTPPIPDPAWSAYVGTVKAGLEKTLANVHTLTTRGEGGLSSSVIVGDRDGMPVRTRIERIDGGVIALDVVLGREYDEMRGATLTLWALPPRELGVNPAGPPAAPLFKTGETSFDERFRVRGNRASFEHLLDEGLRARVVATLDGWLAYWAPDGMRYRVYPSRGAPLDHPIPLWDLALGRPASPDRLVAVIELLVEIAGRGIVLAAPAAPTALDADS